MPEWINPATVLFALALVALVALLWRQTFAIENLSGISVRARDRERQDHHQLIQQLVEKFTAKNAFDMARMHSIERLRKNQLDAETEKEASGNSKPAVTVPEDSQYVDEASYAN